MKYSIIALIFSSLFQSSCCFIHITLHPRIAAHRNDALLRGPLSMTLIPLPRTKTKNLLPRNQVTPAQWRSYWGSTSIETLQRSMESLLFAYGGAWAAWFLSFMAGPFVSAIFGSVTVFNFLYIPYVYAQRNNYKLLYNDKGKLCNHALFRGEIQSLRKIRRRSGKTVGALSQEYLDLVVCDEIGRELEIITPWRDGYLQLRCGMRLETLIASTASTFDTIHAVSEAYIPACAKWVGDYPFLDKRYFRTLCKQLMPLNADSNSIDPNPSQVTPERGFTSKVYNDYETVSRSRSQSDSFKHPRLD